MTRRQFIFLFLVLLAAAPLVWLNVDPNAGDKLLRWTNNTPQRSALTAALEPVAQFRRAVVVNAL